MDHLNSKEMDYMAVKDLKTDKEVSFSIYERDGAYLDGIIKDSCLTIISNVFGDMGDSEKTYAFSKELTEKLFGLIDLDDFIALCRSEGLGGMEEFLKKNKCYPATFVWFSD